MIYEALKEVKRVSRDFPHVVFRHVRRDANKAPDDMGRRALVSKKDEVYWDGTIPEDAPPVSLEEVYDS